MHKESLKNVSGAISSRQKSAKKRGLYGINEYSETIFNAEEMATQITLQRFLGYSIGEIYG